MKTRLPVKPIIFALFIVINLPMLALCGVRGTSEEMMPVVHTIDSSADHSSNVGPQTSNDRLTPSSRDEVSREPAIHSPQPNANVTENKLEVVLPADKLADFKKGGNAVLLIPIQYRENSNNWTQSGEANVQQPDDTGNSSSGGFIFVIGIVFMFTGGVCWIVVLFLEKRGD